VLEAGNLALSVGLELDDIGLEEEVEVLIDAGDVAVGPQSGGDRQPANVDHHHTAGAAPSNTPGAPTATRSSRRIRTLSLSGIDLINQYSDIFFVLWKSEYIRII